MVAKLLNISWLDIRFTFLALGLAIYGAFGVPTPDSFGGIEFLVAVFLILAVNVSGVWNAFPRSEEVPSWQRLGQVLLIFGITVPVLMAVSSGHDIGPISRDLIPFLFMMLGLLLADMFCKRLEMFFVLALAVGGVGVLFSIRALGLAGEAEALDYLANMPTVLFASFTSFGLALSMFVQRFSIRCLPLVALLLGVAGLTFWPMVEAQQRASVGMFVILTLVLLGFLFRDHPKRSFIALILMVAVLLPFHDVFIEVFSALSQKTNLVGMNMRLEELSAVWNVISNNPLNVLFGLGWGASFASPAVADIEVYFTHSLLSSMLLKTGIVGVLLTVVYLAYLAGGLFRSLDVHPALALGIAGPVFIDVFLYASFKSLDFGLVLMLIPALFSYARFSRAEALQKIERRGSVG